MIFIFWLVWFFKPLKQTWYKTFLWYPLIEIPNENYIFIHVLNCNIAKNIQKLDWIHILGLQKTFDKCYFSICWRGLVCWYGAILLRSRHVAIVQSNGGVGRGWYQIGYLQTNQDRDIMARFQLNSGRVKGFICRKHMAAQNPIRQMLELLKAGREISDSKKDCHQNCGIGPSIAVIVFHWKPNSFWARASQNLFQFLVFCRADN